MPPSLPSPSPHSLSHLSHSLFPHPFLFTSSLLSFALFFLDSALDSFLSLFPFHSSSKTHSFLLVFALCLSPSSLFFLFFLFVHLLFHFFSFFNFFFVSAFFFFLYFSFCLSFSYFLSFLHFLVCVCFLSLFVTCFSLSHLYICCLLVSLSCSFHRLQFPRLSLSFPSFVHLSYSRTLLEFLFSFPVHCFPLLFSLVLLFMCPFPFSFTYHLLLSSFVFRFFFFFFP